MGRERPSGGNYFEAGQAITTAPPFSVFLHCTRGTAADISLWEVGDDTDTDHYLGLSGRENGAGDDYLQVSARAGGQPQQSILVTTMPENTWSFVAAVFAASDDRRAFLDSSANKASTTTNRAPSGMNETRVLSVARTSGAWDGPGAVQRIIYWDAVRPDADVDNYSSPRVSPFAFRDSPPDSYWPMLGGTGNARDITGAINLTEFGAVTSVGGPEYRGPRAVD